MPSTVRKWAIIIPARFESSRLPGKPLVNILGVSLIERVWRRCTEKVDKDRVYIATDDERIRVHIESFGGQAIMTSTSCLTGTDRVYEAARKLNLDSVINVQGDEPLIDPQDILLFIEQMKSNPELIFNGMTRIKNKEEFQSPTVPKVVFRADKRLLYMSRAAIPTTKELEFKTAYKQVCIYAFPTSLLGKFVESNEKTFHESIEDIEILRFLEKGYDVKMLEVSGSSIAVDIPEDVVRVERAIKNEAK